MMPDETGRGANRRSFDRSDAIFAEVAGRIPLASQTFSKSHQQWPRRAAPLFLTHGKGARVHDVDGNVYIDYLQGLMANILGYCDVDVDAAIRDQIDRGFSFSLPTTLEDDLAERLIRLIPCAEMVRFGKNGSDATTAAIRVARSVTGRDKVAVCGYHGWHDWYIGTTTRDGGVPESVRQLSSAFAINDAEAITDVLTADPNGYAAVILEPGGAVPLKAGFLDTLRELTERFGVLLVFDEIVTGFRVDIGGAQKRHGVTPDLACFGKAMSNGMPISALVGRRDLMMELEDVFFSGTSGGEALSIAAAIATIDKIEKHGVTARLWQLGDDSMQECNAAFRRHGLGGTLSFGGEAWWPRLAMTDLPVHPLLMTSLLRQEFVAEGLLMAAGINLCLPHEDPTVREETRGAFDRAAASVRAHLDASDPRARLRGELVQPTFSVRPS